MSNFEILLKNRITYKYRYNKIHYNVDHYSSLFSSALV